LGFDRESNPIEMRIRPNKERVIGHRHRCQDLAVQLIHGEPFERRPRLDDRGGSLFAGEIDPAICLNGRGGVVPAQTLLPVDRAGLRVDAGCDAGVVDDVQEVADQDG
jgi:hypothetical protein